jgi:hypothetical protein
MNQDVLEMYRKRFEALAAQMEEETIACTTGWIQVEGQDHEAPAIIVKGGAEARLRRPVVRCQVLGIETSECPVVAVGVEFPHQVDNLASWYWSWVPMHTVEQRELVGLMVTAPAWLVVVFSGELVTRALVVQVAELARARYRKLRQMVESYPEAQQADTNRAIDVAQAATAGALGDGFVLETVKDLDGGGAEASGVGE